MREFIRAKLHGLIVTETSLDYIGSVSVDAALMRSCDIAPYEAVEIVNLSTGGRWKTYAVPAASGVFTLNGGGARLGVPGDRCVLLCYSWAERFEGATVLMIGSQNEISERIVYADS